MAGYENSQTQGAALERAQGHLLFMDIKRIGMVVSSSADSRTLSFA
jgi:hypothetical protein